ncbi:LLM class flavin-dependent oxidoreductase [Streptomyces sp. KL116D]|uniref:LLM class flavin-dependent oxidoreductase n=1 Tax=Streptomyces sp. KL116D TaxID=3045152 RepID=UPI0035584F93
MAPLRPAAQIAEEAAIVDLVSGGRLDLGLGTGYRPPEFDLYGASIAGRYGVTDSRARDIRAHWGVGQGASSARPGQASDLDGLPGSQGAPRRCVLGEGLLSANPNWWSLREGLIAGRPRPELPPGWPVPSTCGPTDGRNGDRPAVRETRAVPERLANPQVPWWRGTDQPVPPPVDPRERSEHRITTSFTASCWHQPEEAAAKVKWSSSDAGVHRENFWARPLHAGRDGHAPGADSWPRTLALHCCATDRLRA